MPELTAEQARHRAAQLNAEHPDRGRYRWLARAGEDGWQVVRIELPGGKRLDPLAGTVEAKPRPAPADDPRPAFWRDVGGPWTGGG
jgi:hypothetical protein